MNPLDIELTDRIVQVITNAVEDLCSALLDEGREEDAERVRNAVSWDTETINPDSASRILNSGIYD